MKQYVDYLFYFFLYLLGITTQLILLIFLITTPTNNKVWEVGFERMPDITIQNNIVTLEGLRDYKHSYQGTTSFDYINRTLDVNNIEQVWFTVQPFSEIKAVAHTYFTFDFKDQDPVVVSVEARREKGEKYNGFVGLLNEYELIYVWSTETDQVKRRVLIDNNKLYMYPLQISKEGAQKLFLQLAIQTQDLEYHPRFYNTLTSNCTNELAKIANKVKPNAVPLDIAYFMPGYSAEALYNFGYLSHSLSFEDLKMKYYISDKVKAIAEKEDFSTQLRLSLTNN